MIHSLHVLFFYKNFIIEGMEFFIGYYKVISIGQTPLRIKWAACNVMKSNELHTRDSVDCFFWE